MSCSSALSPPSPSLCLPSLLLSVFLCFFNKHTDSSTLRCSPENCEVHAHSDVTKKDVTPHFFKKKKKTVASPPLKLQPPTVSRHPSFVFFSLCDGKCFKGNSTQASGYTRSPAQQGFFFCLFVFFKSVVKTFPKPVFKLWSFHTHLLHIRHTFQ